MARTPLPALGGPLVIVVIAVVAVVVSSVGRTGPTASVDAPASLIASSPLMSDPPASIEQPTPVPVLSPASSAEPRATSSGPFATVRPDGRIPWGPNLSGRCTALLPDLPADFDYSDVVHVKFVDPFPPRPVRDAFAATNGLLEIGVVFGGYATKARFDYAILDGVTAEEKARALSQLPSVDTADPASSGGSFLATTSTPRKDSGTEVVPAAITAPPEYDPDGFIPEVLVRFSRPKTDLDIEIWAARAWLRHVGREGDWERFCSDASEFPEELEAFVRRQPDVAVVRLEPGGP